MLGRQGSTSPADQQQSDAVDIRAYNGGAWSSHGQYFSVKRDKLRDQFLTTHGGSGTLLQGLVFYIDGRTHPTMMELMNLIYQYGGSYEQYYSPRRCTHVIAENLAESKAREYAAIVRNAPRIVTPLWLLDSIKKQKLMAEVDYALPIMQGRGDKSQRSVASFFRAPSAAAATVTSPQPHQQQQFEQENDDIAEEAEEDGYADDDDCAELQPLQKRARFSLGEPAAVEAEPESHEQMDVEVLDTSDDVVPDLAVPALAPPPRPAAKTALTDANFIEHYLGNSRLSFIGNWKHKIKRPQAASNVSTAVAASGKRFIVHIDMDCFFASIAMRDNPSLRDKPIAVSHSRGQSGEISSANYVARQYGVGAGMWMKRALEICPNLIIVPYEYQKYDETALKVVDILFDHCNKVNVQSIDEALLDFSEQCADEQQVQTLVQQIRREIEESTGCTASAGISSNILLARIATKKAKPNGQLCITEEEAPEHLRALSVDTLPGVGYKMKRRLEEELGVETCGDLESIELTRLQQLFGANKGKQLYDFCRGIDDRPVQVKSRKSIGMEINYALRFETNDQVLVFLDKMCQHLAQKMKEEDVKGQQLTIKVMQRSADAPRTTAKFLGHGKCDTFSKSVSIGSGATNDASTIFLHARKLYESLTVPAEDLRGLGLHFHRLQISGREEGEEQSNDAVIRLSQFFSRKSKRAERTSAAEADDNEEEAELQADDEVQFEMDDNSEQQQEHHLDVIDLEDQEIEEYHEKAAAPAFTKPRKPQTGETLSQAIDLTSMTQIPQDDIVHVHAPQQAIAARSRPSRATSAAAKKTATAAKKSRGKSKASSTTNKRKSKTTKSFSISAPRIAKISASALAAKLIKKRPGFEEQPLPPSPPPQPQTRAALPVLPEAINLSEESRIDSSRILNVAQSARQHYESLQKELSSWFNALSCAVDLELGELEHQIAEFKAKISSCCIQCLKSRKLHFVECLMSYVRRMVDNTVKERAELDDEGEEVTDTLLTLFNDSLKVVQRETRKVYNGARLQINPIVVPELDRGPPSQGCNGVRCIPRKPSSRITGVY